jgi:uncharacterized protein YecT (DUF1311 family)
MISAIMNSQLPCRRYRLACVLGSSLLGLLLITSCDANDQASQRQNVEKNIDCDKVQKGIDQNTYTLTVCASRQNLANRASMAETLKELHAVLKDYYKDDDGVKILEQSQSSWQIWKSNEAKLCVRSLGYGPDGSGYEFQLNNCAANLTDQRTNELKRYLKEFKSR